MSSRRYPCLDAERYASTSKNKFVFLALKKTLTLAHEVTGAQSLQDTLAQGLDIAIAGDNDFYSQRAKVLLVLYSMTGYLMDLS